jgi:hypothetical protein
VLTIILLVMVLWVVLTILLSAWTLWFQAYVYTEPTPGIIWRGPAAGSAVTVVLMLWILLDYRAPGHFRPLFDSTSTDNSEPFPELIVPGPRGEEVYRLVPPNARLDYRLKGQPTGKVLPTRPKSIIVIEGDEKYIFEPQRDDKGNFKTRSSSSWFGSSQNEELRYIDSRGRVMLESSLGRVSTFRGGRFTGNLLLNLLLLAAFFAVLWLLLRFAWPLALLQAFVFWVVMQLFVLPPVLTRIEEVAKQRAQERLQAT